MLCLDIYLSSQSHDTYKTLKHKITPLTSSQVPLKSWDIFMGGFHNNMRQAKKEIDLKKVLSFAKKFNWKNDLHEAFSENEYEALIITDKNQNIIWTNEGFTTMTGFSKKYALNKTPSFLQGEKTSIETKNRIKEKIALNKPFKERIINYRKDKTTYNCEVKIIPLYNDFTTHFIAFEKQVI